MDDLELLREYAASRSEQVFATLVARHVGLVYSAALRQVRDPHLAEEVTQTVFIRLAQKAWTFRDGVILSGWLFRTTRFVASETMRTENRRRQREQKAMETLYESQGDAPWAQIAPLLDEAMAGLSEPVAAGLDMPDRTAPAAAGAIVSDETIAQRLVGRRLQPGIDAGAHRKPAPIQRLFAVAGEQLAAHLLGKIGSVDDLGRTGGADRFGGFCDGGSDGVGRGGGFNFNYGSIEIYDVDESEISSGSGCVRGDGCNDPRH